MKEEIDECETQRDIEMRERVSNVNTMGEIDKQIVRHIERKREREREE